MKEDNEGKFIYSPLGSQAELSKFLGKIGIPYFIAFIYGIIRLVKYGVCDWQGAVMAIGAVLSIVGLVSYYTSYEEFHNKKSWLGMLLAFLGFIPYLFGCFLVFYKGFWSLKYLFNSFSFWKLVAPFLWIIVGYRIVAQLHMMTEFLRAIDKGRIKIEDEIK